MLKLIFVSFCLLLIQACASTQMKVLDTGAASDLDGAWINEKCMCDGKDDSIPNVQRARTIFVNGNILVQQSTGRWKDSKFRNYCSTLEEAKITLIEPSTFRVDTITDQIFAPGKQKCEVEGPNLNSRTWKIINSGQSELKFESTSGCETGPLICTYKRLDR